MLQYASYPQRYGQLTKIRLNKAFSLGGRVVGMVVNNSGTDLYHRKAKLSYRPRGISENGDRACRTCYPGYIGGCSTSWLSDQASIRPLFYFPISKFVQVLFQMLAISNDILAYNLAMVLSSFILCSSSISEFSL